MQVAAIASSILAPAVGGLVSSIAGDIGKSVLGGAASPLNLLGSIGDAFGHLFGKQSTQRPPFCSPIPLPFSPGPGFPLNNPFGALQDSIGIIKSMIPSLQNALGSFSGAQASAAAAAGGGGRAPSLSRSDFSAPDSLMAQAQDLLKPGPNGEISQANILKAQQLMSAADLIAKTLSKLIEQQFDTAKTAIQAIRG